jgi:hypothetical protein
VSGHIHMRHHNVSCELVQTTYVEKCSVSAEEPSSRICYLRLTRIMAVLFINRLGNSQAYPSN